jgi:hypothetical protein
LLQVEELYMAEEGQEVLEPLTELTLVVIVLALHP